MYPAITESHVFNLPLPSLADDVVGKVIADVQKARISKAHADRLLHTAKQTVELAIEKDEPTALAAIQWSGGEH